MGLASKIQSAGARPPMGAGGPPQSMGAPAPQQSSYGQSQQSSYGQSQVQPPYPVSGGQQLPQQSSYGAPPAPQMGTKPGGYSANQPSSNPFAGQPPSQYGAAPQQQHQQQSQYGAPQSQYGAPPPLPQQYGQQPQYGQPQAAGRPGQPPAQGQYGQPPAPAQGQYGQPPQAQNQGQYGQPGQQYGQQPPRQAGAGAGAGVVRDNLTRIVRENQLESFYPPQRLQQVIQKVESINFGSISATWDIPMEIATDLAALALYDIVLYCDDSGSMRAEERGERIEDLKLILSRVAEVATLFDDDGIQVRFMNSDVQGNGIRTGSAATQLVEQVRFSGITPLATQLDRKVIQPLVLQAIRSRALQKPVLVVVITDGEPVGEPRDLTRRVIAGSAQQAAQMGVPGAIRYQLAQVGKDAKAQAFLGELDNDPQIGRVIDATSYFEMEQAEMEKKGINLTPDLWLVKLCVGAIDSSYDEQDE